MFKKLVFTFSCVFLVPVFVFGQNFDLEAFKNTTSGRQQLMYNMQNNTDDLYVEDSVEYEYEKSPGKAFLMSALIPGAGEIYTGKWGRAAGFLGMEALFWTMHFVKKSQGQDIEDEYKKYADNYWDFETWLNRSTQFEGIGPEGSHHLYAIVEKFDSNNDSWVPIDSTVFVVGEDYDQVMNEYYQIFHSEGIRFVPVKNRDFYENIGKYDQFSAGWDDFETDSTVSDHRDHYLTRREDSNNALKMASQFGTGIIINHIVSAIHAQIMAKTYKSDGEEIGWNVSLMTDIRRKYLINGVNLSIRF